MSKSYMTSMNTIKRRAGKRHRSPEEARFMSLFGATDARIASAPSLDRMPVAEQDMALGPLLGLPLAPAVPLAPVLDGHSVPREMDTGAVIADHQPAPSQAQDNLPALLPSTRNTEAFDATPDGNDLDTLLGLLDDTAIRVTEVKQLPEGTIRITVDEILAGSKQSEPAYVPAGGVS
jgi:hypothetical protein